jgi:WD40 repeat protein/tRNA A-37 threonylcarbamoyl transferase component Bud32
MQRGDESANPPLTDTWQRREEIVRSFEDAWRAGERPAIDDYLPPDASERHGVLVELIHVDMERRLEKGEAVRAETYLARYPLFKKEAALVVELIAAEYRLRQSHGEPVTPAEYLQRFPDFRDQLHARILEPGSAESEDTGQRLPVTPAPVAVPARRRGAADRNLLFGILALQMDFISRDALIAAMNAWVLDKTKSLAEILVEQKALAASRRALLEPLVEEHIKQHGNDAEKSLASVSSVGSLRDELGRIGDADVQATLPTIASARSDADPHATRDYVSAGESTSAGQRFRILRPHAKGGLGEVFVARDEELRREVALKQIQGRYADDARSRARFVLEAEVTGGLEHPGIVPVYGLGQYADGRPFYAMRFVKGDSLRDAIERYHKTDGKSSDSGERALEFRRLLSRFMDVCNAIGYAHSRGVLHRDLKPGNIMLGPYGETLVVDWGLAKVVGHSEGLALLGESTLRPEAASGSAPTIAGTAVGTPQFMSPEQAAGKLDQLGPGTDVYSLGATLYCLLTGRVPFQDTDVTLVLARVRMGEFRRPRSVNPDVPLALEAICLKAMALRPEDRYRTTRTLADDIERWLADTAARANLYVAHMNLAQRAWEDAHIGRVAELLEGQRPEHTGGIDLRGFEWHYWWTRSHSELLTLEGHAGRIRSIAFSPDGKRIVSGSDDSTLKVWDTATGQETMTLKGHTGLIRSVAFSPDGKSIASGSFDSTLKVWDAATGHPTVSLKLASPVSSVAFSPDGKRIVGGSDDSTLKLWDAATGQETLVLKGHARRVASVVFSPDGKRIASGSFDSTLKVWDAATGHETVTVKLASPISSVAFSPDGKRIASGSWDKTLKIWDAASGREIRTRKGHAGPILSVVFSLDGKRIASGSWDKTLKVWDAATGRRILTLKGHARSIQSVLFSPDGKRIVSGSADGTLKVWDGTTGQNPLTLKGHDAWVYGVAFSPDGKRIVSGSDDSTLKVWDAATGQETMTLKGHTGTVYSVAFSPDGKRIASGSNDNPPLKVWDATTGRETLTLKGYAGTVYSVAFSPDGKSIASGGNYYGTIKICDATTGQVILILKGHTDTVNGVEFSPDGKRIVSGSADGTLKLWDAATGQETLTLKGHTEEVVSVAFSPDGESIASASDDNTLKLWDAATGQETLVLKGHAGRVASVVFSPDGKRIASGSADRTVKVWDAATGQETLSLEGHAGQVWSVAFSSDGKRIASSSDDGKVRVWDASPPRAPSPTATPSSGHAAGGRRPAQDEDPVYRTPSPP